MSKTQNYKLDLSWQGNHGAGTMTHTSYDRNFTTHEGSRPPVLGSSHPAFRGNSERYCPEELLLASLSSCHMLWYLHMCAAHEVVVLEYHDHPVMEMEVKEFGNGDIRSATLSPVVRIASEDQREQAMAMHQRAHQSCFIAKAVNFEIILKPKIVESES